jgi:methionyl aminopeptidase
MSMNEQPVKLNREEIAKMRIAGKLASEVLDYITPYVQEGVSTFELDALCYNYIVNVQQAIPAPLNYQPSASFPPYPCSICTSVNEVICHGIPSHSKILKAGDILNIDVNVIKNQYHGDTSRMFLVGAANQISEKAKKLCEVTYNAMWKGIQQVAPGKYVGDIGHAIQQYVEPFGYGIVDDYCGHGIGSVFHTGPQISHIGKPNTGMQLFEGMAFTIEPMINIGTKAGRVMTDKWTVKTRDNSLSAQWEHTILVTATGFEIMTLSAGSPPLPSFMI